MPADALAVLCGLGVAAVFHLLTAVFSGFTRERDE